MGKSKKTQTVQQTQQQNTQRDPWAPAAGYLNDAMKDVADLYRSGGPPVYRGQRVVNWSDQTRQAMDNMATTARAGPFGVSQAQGALSRSMSGVVPYSGEISAFSQMRSDGPGRRALEGDMSARGPGIGALKGLFGQDASGAGIDALGGLYGSRTTGAGVDALTDLFGRRSSGAGIDALRSYADPGARTTGRGVDAMASFLDDGPNPYLGSLYSQGARDITDSINGQFTASGRYGSGAHTGQLARGLGDFATNLYGQAYETDRNRKLTAAGELLGLDQADRSMGLSAAGTLAGIDVGDLDRDFGIGSALAGIDEGDFGRNIGLASTMAGIDVGNLDRRVGIGNTLAGIDVGNADRRFQQASRLSDLEQADIDRALSGAITNAGLGMDQQRLGLQGASMLPGLYDYGNAGNRDLLAIGNMLEGKAGEQLGADRALFDETTTQPFRNTEWFSQLMSGFGGLGGSESSYGTSNDTTTQTSSSSPLMQALGAASMISGMFGNPFAGAMSGGLSSLLGRGASGMAGIQSSLSSMPTSRMLFGG